MTGGLAEEGEKESGASDQHLGAGWIRKAEEEERLTSMNNTEAAELMPTEPGWCGGGGTGSRLNRAGALTDAMDVARATCSVKAPASVKWHPQPPFLIPTEVPALGCPSGAGLETRSSAICSEDLAAEQSPVMERAVATPGIKNK